MLTIARNGMRFRQPATGLLQRTWGGVVKFLKTEWLTIFCFSAIAAVAALDTYWAAANESIQFVERNPICLWLIELDPDSMFYFCAGKTLSNLAVLLMLASLKKLNYAHTKIVMISVASFQLGLLTHLCLSDPLTYNLPNFALLFRETPESLFRL